MKWVFYVVGAVVLVAGVALTFSAQFIFHSMAGIMIAIFGLLCVGIGAIIGRKS